MKAVKVHEYPELVIRSESTLCSMPDKRLMHGAMGICTEAGEIMDIMKKAMFYENQTNFAINLKEELGDLFWYVGLICFQMDWNIEDLMGENITKLKQRYPEKFTKKDEQSRNYDQEAKAVEDKDN